MRKFFWTDFSAGLKRGMGTGIGLAVVAASVSVGYATYATLTASTSEVLSKNKWNEMIQYTVPPSAVMAFNSTACPTNWSPADGTGGRPDLRGQFIRGLNTFDNGATVRSDGNQDPATRTLWNFQNDALQNHRHFHGTDGSSNSGYSNGANGNQSGGSGYQQNTSSVPVPITSWGTAIKTDNAETRPKNVALIYCVKD